MSTEIAWEKLKPQSDPWPGNNPTATLQVLMENWVLTLPNQLNRALLQHRENKFPASLILLKLMKY